MFGTSPQPTDGLPAFDWSEDLRLDFGAQKEPDEWEVAARQQWLHRVYRWEGTSCTQSGTAACRSRARTNKRTLAWWFVPQPQLLFRRASPRAWQALKENRGPKHRAEPLGSAKAFFHSRRLKRSSCSRINRFPDDLRRKNQKPRNPSARTECRVWRPAPCPPSCLRRRWSSTLALAKCRSQTR